VEQAEHGRAFQEANAELPGGLRVGERQAIGVGVAVILDVRDAPGLAGLEPRNELSCFIAREVADVDAVGGEHRVHRCELLCAALRGRDPEAAALPEAGILAERILELGDRLARAADDGEGRRMQAPARHEARRARRGAGGEAVALEDDDLVAAAAREVPRNAATENAAADDDDGGALWHGLVQASLHESGQGYRLRIERMIGASTLARGLA
jgi:hypothetical protein